GRLFPPIAAPPFPCPAGGVTCGRPGALSTAGHLREDVLYAPSALFTSALFPGHRRDTCRLIRPGPQLSTGFPQLIVDNSGQRSEWRALNAERGLPSLSGPVGPARVRTGRIFLAAGGTRPGRYRAP